MDWSTFLGASLTLWDVSTFAVAERKNPFLSASNLCCHSAGFKSAQRSNEDPKESRTWLFIFTTCHRSPCEGRYHTQIPSFLSLAHHLTCIPWMLQVVAESQYPGRSRQSWSVWSGMISWCAGSFPTQLPSREQSERRNKWTSGCCSTVTEQLIWFYGLTES